MSTQQTNTLTTKQSGVYAIVEDDLYDTTNNEDFSGYEGYYFKEEDYPEFVKRYRAQKPEVGEYEHVELIDEENHLCAVYIGPGEQFSWINQEKPEGWNIKENRHQVCPGMYDWFIIAYAPEETDSRSFSNDYIIETGVVCKNPWSFREELRAEGYIEVSHNENGRKKIFQD